MPTLRHALIVSAFVALAPVMPRADDGPPNEPHWRIVLEGQLKSERGCQLSEVISYQEIPLGDGLSVDGRISCIDGREFNFSRQRKHQKFSIELCAPAVC